MSIKGLKERRLHRCSRKTVLPMLGFSITGVRRKIAIQSVWSRAKPSPTIDFQSRINANSDDIVVSLDVVLLSRWFVLILERLSRLCGEREQPRSLSGTTLRSELSILNESHEGSIVRKRMRPAFETAFKILTNEMLVNSKHKWIINPN